MLACVGESGVWCWLLLCCLAALVSFSVLCTRVRCQLRAFPNLPPKIVLLSCCLCVQTTLLPDCPNPSGVLSSKATGEPSYALGMSAHFAVKYAVSSARSDAGNTDYFDLPLPATPCAVATACATTTAMFQLTPASATASAAAAASSFAPRLPWYSAAGRF